MDSIEEAVARAICDVTAEPNDPAGCGVIR